MGSIEAALKPRLRLRAPSEYAGWVLSSLVGLGILASVLSNSNFKLGIVGKYFFAESILRGPMPTIVTHEMGFAREVADSLTSTDDGFIIGRGDAKEVLRNPKERRTQAFLKQVL